MKLKPRFTEKVWPWVHPRSCLLGCPRSFTLPHWIWAWYERLLHRQEG